MGILTSNIQHVKHPFTKVPRVRKVNAGRSHVPRSISFRSSRTRQEIVYQRFHNVGYHQKEVDKTKGQAKDSPTTQPAEKDREYVRNDHASM